MGSTKPESSASSNLALVACAMVGTLALSVPATALLMHYFSSNIEPGNTTMQASSSLSLTNMTHQLHPTAVVFYTKPPILHSPLLQGSMARTSEDSNMEALRNDKINKNLRTRQNHMKPAAHLIGMAPSNINRLGWENRHNENFPHLVDKSQSLSLIIPQSGFYYVYYQVGFRGRGCKNDRSQLTLNSQVFQKHESYSDEPVILLEGMETVCGEVNSSEMWYTSVSQGRLVQLQQYHCLFIKVSNPELVDYDEGKTYFGVMMVS